MRKYTEIMSIMQEHALDGIVFSNPYNIRYLTGFSGEGCFYVDKKTQIIITDSRYTIAAKKAAKNLEDFLLQKGMDIGQGIEVQETSAKVDANHLLASCMEKVQAVRIGFEDEDILYADFMKMQNTVSESLAAEFVPLGAAISWLRAVKTDEEIALLSQAEHIGDIAFTHILNVIKPGVTELEIAAQLAYVMQKNGAEGLSFETIVASGIHSSMPHALVTDKKIEKGDFVTMDFGCRYQGYCSDMTRTIVVGKASKEQKKIYDTVLEAQLAALEYIRAGRQGKEVDAIARDIIKKAGYGDCFGHGLGHSVGLFIHEEPRLSVREERILQENMIETVEPGIYVEGFGGVRIEDMVVVTKEGHKNLAHSVKELVEL